jgi:hypothetical protein
MKSRDFLEKSAMAAAAGFAQFTIVPQTPLFSPKAPQISKYFKTDFRDRFRKKLAKRSEIGEQDS